MALKMPTKIRFLLSFYFSLVGTFTSIFKNKTTLQNHQNSSNQGISYFFGLGKIRVRIRIRMRIRTNKLTDLDPVLDPEHCARQSATNSYISLTFCNFNRRLRKYSGRVQGSFIFLFKLVKKDKFSSVQALAQRRKTIVGFI